MKSSCLSLIPAVRTFLIAALLLCGAVMCVPAQNNSHHINDKLMPLYVRAFNNRMNEKGILMADTLRRRAIAIGDRYAEMNALTIPFYYEYFKKDNMRNLDMRLKTLSDKAKEYQMWDFYYLGVSNKVSYYLREYKYVEAFLYLQQQSDFARKHNHKEGIRWTMRMEAVIEQYRGELSQAIDGFKRTIEYSKKNTPQHNLAREYVSMCDCYRMMGDFEKLLAAAKEGQQATDIPHELRNLKQYEAYSLFMLGREEEFKAVMAAVNAHKGGLQNNVPVFALALQACEAMALEGDEKAMRLMSDVKKRSENEYWRLACIYHKRKGNLLKSIEAMRQLMYGRFNYSEFVMKNDIKSSENIFLNQNIEKEKQRIANDNARLQLHNTQLSLSNYSLEVERSRDAANLAIATADRNSLAAAHQKLLARELRDSLAIQNAKQEAKENDIRQRRRVLTTSLVIAIIAVIVITANACRKLLMTKKLKRANAQLEKDIRQLKRTKSHAMQSERMKTLFIQNMSHEIRTPLNAVVGFAELLTDPDSPLDGQERGEMAKYIADNSELLTTLVGDIIDITTLQSDSLMMSLQETRVNEICHEALLTVDHRKAEGVRLCFATDVSDSLTTLTDRHRVSQVLINMLTNAEKNTTSGSITLRCSAQENPGMLTFSVADTGCGVPKELQDEIFKRFCKLDSSKPGSGLGLDICRMIAEKLGGEINIDKEYTGGARFWFTIPLKNEK